MDQLYWYWLPRTARPDHSDPNRLVLEQRVPASSGSDPSAYKKEYWYDPGGNRLSMRESTYNDATTSWTPDTVTRYNYAHTVNYDLSSDYGDFNTNWSGEPDANTNVAVPTLYDAEIKYTDPPWDVAGYWVARNHYDLLKSGPVAKGAMCAFLRSDPFWKAANTITVASPPGLSYPTPSASGYQSCKKCPDRLPALQAGTFPGGGFRGGTANAWPQVPRLKWWELW